MRTGKRDPQSLAARRRGAWRPKAEVLEGRILLAIDLGGSSPPNLPAIATNPVGIDMAGGQPAGGAGFSVTDVGDMNNDGFDDFVIGAPTINIVNGQPVINRGNNSQAYLIYGSKDVTAGTVSWLTLNAIQRVGDLNQLGNVISAQQNPITGDQGFAFQGVTFFTSQSNAQLGASVAPAGFINGLPAFLVGSPGATDSTGTVTATGRAYLVYGGFNPNALTSKLINLDTPGANQGVTFVTFDAPSTAFGAAQIGRGVSGAGDFFTENANSVAIGAPNATYNGNANAGAVFVISAKSIPNSSAVLNLATVGQTGGLRGVLFGGPVSGAAAGFSIANAGSVDGALNGFNARVPDLLIGAPGASAAFLVYGGGGLFSKTVTVGGLNSIPLDIVGDTTVTPTDVLGAVFTGNGGDGTGYSVSSAGDFNADGFNDVMIGSPFAGGNTGYVSVIYGQPASGTAVKGVIPLTNIPTTINSVTFTGAVAGALAGYSVSSMGRARLNNPANDILIGSPGENANAGAAYFIPGNPGGLTGVQSLATAESQPVVATKFTLSNPSLVIPSFFGASVSGITPSSVAGNNTSDGDALADFIVGAPGYTVVNGRSGDGGAFILEAADFPVGTPVNTNITETVGINSANAPFTVVATATSLKIFVDSIASIPFNPVTDLNPATVVVNGVPFANATIAADPVDENSDGIPDAIITISPVSRLALTNGVNAFTVTARTLASSVNANRTFVGTQNNVVVTGSSSGGGGGTTVVAAGPPIGEIVPTTFVPPFGNDRAVPPPSVFNLYDYKPIPFRIVYQQYHPLPGYTQRMLNYFLPNKYHFQRQSSSNDLDKTKGVYVLNKHTFDTSKYHPGKRVEFTHKVVVLPSNRQHELFAPIHSTKGFNTKLP